MADIFINGVTYASVPRIDVPKPNNGGSISFYETSGDTATAADIASGKTAHGATGLIVGEATPATPNLQSKTVTPARTQQTVSPDAGYDGLSSVTVDASPVKGITISAGMAGNQGIMPASSYVGFGPINVQPLQNKTVSPSAQQQTIMADNYNNYLGLGVVTIEAINLQSKTVNSSTTQQVVTADSGYDGLDEVTVEPFNLQSKSVTPSASQQVVTPDTGYDGLDEVTVGAVSLQSKTVYPHSSEQSITADTGYSGLDTVTVKPDIAMKASQASSSEIVELDFSGSDGSSFGGWGQYFRSTSEDTGFTAGASQWGSVRRCKIKLPEVCTSIAGRAFAGMSGLSEIDASAVTGTIALGARSIFANPLLSTAGTAFWNKLKSVTNSSIRPTSGTGASVFEYGNDIEAPNLDTITGSSYGYCFSNCGFRSFKAPKLPYITEGMF